MPRAAHACAVALAITCGAGVADGRAAPVPSERDASVVAGARTELEARGAPLASVLVHLAALAGDDARVADGIAGRVDGTLVGEAGALIALLAKTHALEIHREGRTLWFDRRGHAAVDFVPLERAALARALEALAAPLAPGGTVQVEAAGRGLVLSGTRAYLRASLARIALATGGTLEPKALPATAAHAPHPDPVARPTLTPDALLERIVLVSSRRPRFVELDDGTRLVAGSPLADGWRLRGIARERLTFARAEGMETSLAWP